MDAAARADSGTNNPHRAPPINIATACTTCRIGLERFQAKWIPVRDKKKRQTKNLKNLEPRSDSIGTEKALGNSDEIHPARFSRNNRDGHRFYSLHWPPCDFVRGDHSAVFPDLALDRQQERRPGE